MSVPHALLTLLERGPSYGLRLKEDFEAWTGEVWPLNAGQVYTTLQRLERDGYVIAEGPQEANQRHYALADSGRSELRRWLTTPSGPGAPPRDELVIKVLMSLMVTDVETRAVVQSHRRGLMEELQSYTRAKAAMSDGGLAGNLVLDAQIFRTEAMVRWLDLCEMRIDHGGLLQPPAPPALDRPRRPRIARATDSAEVAAQEGGR